MVSFIFIVGLYAVNMKENSEEQLKKDIKLF